MKRTSKIINLTIFNTTYISNQDKVRKKKKKILLGELKSNENNIGCKKISHRYNTHRIKCFLLNQKNCATRNCVQVQCQLFSISIFLTRIIRDRLICTNKYEYCLRIKLAAWVMGVHARARDCAITRNWIIIGSNCSNNRNLNVSMHNT